MTILELISKKHLLRIIFKNMYHHNFKKNICSYSISLLLLFTSALFYFIINITYQFLHSGISILLITTIFEILVLLCKIYPLFNFYYHLQVLENKYLKQHLVYFQQSNDF